ncbi:hypothetical protein, partial [Azotobacter beijerinckii]
MSGFIPAGTGIAGEYIGEASRLIDRFRPDGPPFVGKSADGFRRVISAGTGNTWRASWLLKATTVHPRGRGEHIP